MILSLRGSRYTNEISFEPIRFLESLKLRGSEITYFLVIWKWTVEYFLFYTACLNKITFNASQFAYLTLCWSGQSSVQLSLMSSWSCALSLTPLHAILTMYCVSTGPLRAEQGWPGRQGSSRNVQSRLLFSTLTFAEILDSVEEVDRYCVIVLHLLGLTACSCKLEEGENCYYESSVHLTNRIAFHHVISHITA